MKALFCSFFLCISSLTILHAQHKTGPYIMDFGAVYTIDHPDLPADTSMTYRIMFDLSKGSSDTTLDRQLNTAARFLNMHGQAGVPLEQLKVVCILHGNAAFDGLSNARWREKYGTDNPNRPLIRQLKAAGVELYVCGQSLHARGIDPKDLVPEIKISLSAMTAILHFREKGYSLLAF